MKITLVEGPRTFDIMIIFNIITINTCGVVSFQGLQRLLSMQ